MLNPPVRHRRRAIHLAIVSVITTLPGISANAAEETTLGETVVSATRRETAVDNIPATVTTLNRQEMDRRLPGDEADLFRDEPDITMAHDQRRFGSTRVNIRGIEDNRVVQMIDGVRLPDYYNGGGPTNYTMNAGSAPMLDFLNRVEVVRGPASSLYGSDALGGVVGYRTLNPGDLLTTDGKDYAVRLRGAYFGASDTYSGSVIGAWRSEMFDALIGYAQSYGHETDNKGDNNSFGPYRSTPNPATTHDRGVLAKFILRPAAGHQVSAIVEGREQETQTTFYRIPSSMSRVSAMNGDDDTRRYRASLEYEHRPTDMFYDRLLARVYHQNSETRNDNGQTRSNARYTTAGGCSASSSLAPRATCDIAQQFSFDQTDSGLNLQFESATDWLGAGHLLTYGVDLRRQRVEQMRDGTILNVNTGQVTKVLAGEVFPLRDFPIGETDSIGLFAEDQISLVDNRLLLTLGVRYDKYDLKPELDSMSQQALTAMNRQAVEQSYNQTSPKLGAIWKFDDIYSLYGQIATGFRAPNYNEVNGAFRNPAQLYAITPNPDLKPETSVGGEIGLRAVSATARGQIAFYDNRYTDFIENMVLRCPGDPRCVRIGGVNYVTYMNQNLANVRIYGAEVRGSWNFAHNWRVDGAVAYTHGEDTDRHQPLNSIEPMKGTFGVIYDTGVWGGEARIRAAAAKTDVDETNGAWFKPPGYAVADLSGWVSLTRQSRIVVAVNNLFDQKYYLWGDIRQADATNPTGVEFYSQPGRNVRVALQADF